MEISNSASNKKYSCDIKTVFLMECHIMVQSVLLCSWYNNYDAMNLGTGIAAD